MSALEIRTRPTSHVTVGVKTCKSTSSSQVSAAVPTVFLLERVRETRFALVIERILVRSNMTIGFCQRKETQ